MCVFAQYEDYDKAPYLKDVKRAVTTRAHAPVVFGVYAPGCASLDCIGFPMLQCWAEVDGQSITVQTRYAGEQRVGAKCTTHCESVTAACDTPNLVPGTYTIHYAGTTTKLKVPGTFRPTCVTPRK